MTDAAVSVIQSAVERFTERYLTSVGCKLEKRGNEWDVTVPEDIDAGLPEEDFTLHCGEPPSESAESVEPLHPESSIFQRILTEVSERALTGRIRVPSENTRVELPNWLREAGIDVEDTTFTPYYDRTAVVILFRVRIETVSEYQTELLRSIAVDVRSREQLPELEETFLTLTSPDSESVESKPADIEADRFDEVVSNARERITERVKPDIDEIHEEASQAADAELEEYRQMRQQQIEELEDQRSSLSSKIAELSDTIHNDNNQDKHIESLKKRKELKAESEDIESELEEIRRRREQGFPEKQREIRDRHALEVIVAPVTMTQAEYERGEVDIELSEGASTQTLTVGYGSGLGVTEKVNCLSCDRDFTESNPVQTLKEGLCCQECASSR